jgi:AcrR family transcriptional regulator
MAAALDILEDEGPAALTLRAVSRRAGVSHTAARHHFDDVTGLLTEVAAAGFRRLYDHILAEAERDPQSRTLGVAYVTFAMQQPTIFRLMFQDHRIDIRRPSYEAATDKMISFLANLPDPSNEVQLMSMNLPRVARIGAMWGVVHGLAMLTIDGRLAKLVRLSDPPVSDQVYIEAVLAADPFGRTRTGRRLPAVGNIYRSGAK